MKLRDWNIWYTYSTYFDSSFDDLEDLARLLVTSGIAHCSIHRNGRTYWRSGDQCHSGTTIFHLRPSGDQATFELLPDQKNIEGPTGLAIEGWRQSANFRFHELKIFGEDFDLPPSYIRAYLGPCDLESEAERSSYRCYPIIKIHTTGVVILEMRLLSSGEESGLRDFINEYVNFFSKEFTDIQVSPAIARIAPLASELYEKNDMSFIQRAKLVSLGKQHDHAIDLFSYPSRDGDFEFDFAPLALSGSSTERETITSLSMTLFGVIGYVLTQPRTGLAYVIRGQKELLPLGHYWSGRPHVHLTRFPGQCETAWQNEEMHTNSFAWLLARSEPKETVPPYPLPPDLRKSEDYNCYVNSAMSLWVWSKAGVARNEPLADPNDGHLIYENQTVVEMLEYGYALYRSLFHKSQDVKNLDTVLRLQREIIQLEVHLAEASKFGEIRELLQKGWNAFNLERLKDGVRDSLAVREAETHLNESRWRERVTRRLAILFGAIAGIPIGKSTLESLWDAFGGWRPQPPLASDILLVSITFLLILGCVAWLTRQSK